MLWSGMDALSPSPGSFVISTALGFVAIAWNGRGLTRLILPEADADTAAARLAARSEAAPPCLSEPGMPEADLPAGIARIVADIRLYAQGEPVDFSSAPVDLAWADAFSRDIYAAARRLTHGEVVTYGELAAAAGHPGTARETGTALGRNPVPLVVPCHRIVAAGGRLGGFSAPGGATTKMRLLAHEHARFPARVAAQGSFAF